MELPSRGAAAATDEVTSLRRRPINRTTDAMVAGASAAIAAIARTFRLLPVLNALAVLTAVYQPAAAAAECLIGAEKTVSDVRALQSQLMIAALTCDQQDEYNVFVQRHQTELLDSYDQVAAHFDRAYGPVGEQRRDEYIAELANAQSLQGVRQGSAFCRNVKPFVLQALTLQNVHEMSRFVTERNVINPYSLTSCDLPRHEAREASNDGLISRQDAMLR